MNTSETICAIATPPGNGGVAVIRISGNDAFRVSDGLFSKDIFNLPANTVTYGTILDDTQVIDACVVTKFIGPHSFTGEDVIEIGCHGSIYIQQRLIHALIKNGARMAGPGEFTMRAYLNQKMDLSQAEAVADLIASESEAAHKMSMHQLRGGFSKDLKLLRQQLIDFASLIELELDFSEEDVEFADRSQLNSLIDGVLTFIGSLIQSFDLGNVLKSGVPVAIVGEPNAGKSTLLNALLNEERAIVSDIPGTTRDTIEELLILKGIKFRLIDTAGIRTSQNNIEQIGVKRSYASVKKAQIVLLIYDGTKGLSDSFLNDLRDLLHEDQRLVVVANKTDLSTLTLDSNHIQISALTKNGLSNLTDALNDYVNDKKQGQNSDTIISNQRHLEALEHAYADLKKVANGLTDGITGDFIAMDIRSALRHLGSITGEVSTDNLLGNIFSRFCIGK